MGVAGVRVGHWTDPVGLTGCTVLLLPPGSTGSCEVRGGAPASRELDVLAPDKTVDTVDAVVLTGGSAFGLACADGVMRYLREQGRGVLTPGGPVPIVPTLGLFDLGAGEPIAPTADHGYAAAGAAAGDQVLHGRIGAGTGAHIGQWRGPDGRRPGGIAYAERRLGEVVVAALCAVNAFGDIDDGTGEISLDAVSILQPPVDQSGSRTHTTIGAVLTNARLGKTDCHIVAQGAHDGLARAITPPHTRFDGDAFIAIATGTVPTAVDIVRLLALSAVAGAIRSLAQP
ncbi:peptidase S58 family protein [Nocardia stercoris]|uniref:Peptidase S58 family protein n=1 Tax=Nocardia stercoris TaxID=2483361 RepID=A0A3M2L7S3_9NOCA|nr:peptidase S58 family protein [Nocardia stercoris]